MGGWANASQDDDELIIASLSRTEPSVMTIRIGIDGFGRIARTFVRRSPERGDVEMAAGSVVSVFGWCDNEWGDTCRLADLTAIVGERP
jgi:glyceraldehyde-3-phosphate dehydrogenase/erythrose-4-phosphate dehydrogenase